METDGLLRRLRLMILTHPRPASGDDLVDVARACVRAGATCVQLRDKNATDEDLLSLATQIGAVARAGDALFLLNDRFDVALAAGADGVHLGPDDIPVSDVRRCVPPEFVIGFSTDDPELALEAARQGASYVGVGAVFGTASKPGLREEAIGPGRVGEVLRRARLPGVGIGGITPENAGRVAAQGAGVAVLGAVMESARPTEVVRALRAAVDAAWSDGTDAAETRGATWGLS